MLRELTVSFDPGVEDVRVAVILQCPGHDEEQAVPKHPAAGATGKNLRELLNKIRKGVKEPFKEDLRYDEANPESGVMVCNAHSRVYYRGSANGNAPGDIECRQVKWVGKQIKGMRLVLCFGKDAGKCYDLICSCKTCDSPNVGQIVVKCCHIGNKGLNRVLPTESLKKMNVGGMDPRLARLSIVSQYVTGVVNNEIAATVSFAHWLRCRGESNCQ